MTSLGGNRSGPPVTAATSRARPTIDSRSPRFGLTSISRTVSPNSSTSGRPSGVSAGRMRIPSASAVSPSSSPEQSMPLLTTPIFSVRSIRRSPGSTAPGRATGTRWPAAMFVAPHTISSGSPSPSVTRVSDSRSARGWRSTDSSSPTTTFRQSSPQRMIPLTSMPSTVNRSASCSGDRSTSTYSAQPRQRHPHRSCSRKRRSFSRNSRRSVMPCLSILIRSGPIPKANPW